MAITAKQIAIIESFAGVVPRPSLRDIGRQARGVSAPTVAKFLRRAHPGRAASSLGIDGKVRRFPKRRKPAQLILRSAIETHARKLRRALELWEGGSDFIKRIHDDLETAFGQHL